MIQRPQTIFLGLSAILNLIVFFTPVYSHAVNDPAAWIGLGFALVLTGVVILASVSIFLFKNRVNQLRWVKVATYLQITAVGFSAGILFSLGGFGSFSAGVLAGTALIVFSLVLLWLAGRSVKKDEELVKSMDRIR